MTPSTCPPTRPDRGALEDRPGFPAGAVSPSRAAAAAAGDATAPPAGSGRGGVETPHRLVRASAGSGKTHRLATRYLEILFAGGRPESIVAVTFTREAAGEILGRVLTRLAGAAADADTAARLAGEIGRANLRRGDCERALRTLVAGLDRVVVSTLDSFFFRLTVALRFELGLRGIPAVAALDDALLATMREEALEVTLSTLAEDDWQDLVDLFERLHGSAARRSVGRALDLLLLELYEIYLEAPERELWGRLELPAPPSPPAVAAALDQLEGFLRASAPGALRRALADDLELARRGDWERLLERGLAGKLVAEPAATRFGSAAIPRAWSTALAVLIAQARHAVLASRVERSRATHHLLDAFHREYWGLRRRRGLLLFTDLAAVLARWLPSRSREALEELYYRVDARVQHLLLDEFQDTSLAQWSVLRPIAEEIRSWGDGSRTFFCVGDPKQAIYGWRGGCADLFDQIEVDLELDPASEERLEESWRSSPVVLEVTNRVFGSLREVAGLAEHGDAVARWTAAFGAHRARVDLPGYAELVESPSADDHLDWAAGRVAALIAALPRASIAVLVQTNDQAVAVLEALRHGGVEASGEGAGAVADDPAVAAVIAALRLADHPGDGIAAFHVASCPLGAVIGLRSVDAESAIDASRRVRRALVERGGRELLAGWKRSLRGVLAARSRARLAQAIDLAARFDAEGGGRPGDLAAFLARALVESPRRTGARVMTIHRAKGLEFDCVVLPALERRLLRGVDTPVYLVRRSPLAPVEAVHRAAPASVRRLAPELEDGFAQEQARRLRDDLSVLYVGLTRARHTLHLWVEPRGASAGASGPPLSFASILRATLSGSAMELAAPAVGATSYGGERTPIYRAGALDAVVERLRAVPPTHPAPQRRRPPSSSWRGGGAGPGALRPAVPFEEIAAREPLRASALLEPRAAGGGAGPAQWVAIEAGLADPTATVTTALAAARAWLSASGGGPGRLEHDRRFVSLLGETTIAGTLPRVWIAEGVGVAPRALVGLDDQVLRRAMADAPQGARTASSTLEARRRVAARGLGLEEGQVALLLAGGDEPHFLPPLRGGARGTR